MAWQAHQGSRAAPLLRCLGRACCCATRVLQRAFLPPLPTSRRPTGPARPLTCPPPRRVADQARQAADQARHAAKAASAKLREGATELAANLSSWWAALEPGNQFSLGAGASAQSRHQVWAWGCRWGGGGGRAGVQVLPLRAWRPQPTPQLPLPASPPSLNPHCPPSTPSRCLISWNPRPTLPAQDYSAIQLRLGLDAGEAILESFKCQLLQAYTCTNNPFTPDRQASEGCVCCWAERGGGLHGLEAARPQTQQGTGCCASGGRGRWEGVGGVWGNWGQRGPLAPGTQRCSTASQQAGHLLSA